MRRKPFSKRRYKWIMWDGIWDTVKEEYVSWYEIEEVMNDTNNQIKVWQKKYDEMKEKYERCKNGEKKA